MSILIFMAVLGLTAPADDPAEIGRSIQAVDRLLEYRLPADPTDADRTKAKELRIAAIKAGQTTRLYPWVLGRLKLEVELVKSSIRATEPARKKEALERIAFLQRLILEIDAPY